MVSLMLAACLQGSVGSYLPIVTQDDDTNVVSLEVKSHALNSRLELHHLTGLDLGETEDSGDTITDGNDGSELFQVVLEKAMVRYMGTRIWRPSYLALPGERSTSDALVFK